MPLTTLAIPLSALQEIGISENCKVNYQLTPDELVLQTLERKEGTINDTGALCINTGKYTGRSPQDKFIVKDSLTENTVFWNNFNIPIEPKYFQSLKKQVLDYLNTKEEVWVRDAFACANEKYHLNIRVVNENPWSNLFAYNMFLRPNENTLDNFVADWHIIQAPGFQANPLTDGTRQQNFAIVSFTEKTIIIGGTGYTGEIKKGIFTILNYILPLEKDVLSMHCSANMGSEGDVAIFFGLSGTGKTTLSADPNRKLIGDDEHGWNAESIFNFEGGCYAKCIDLSAEKEPQIYKAIKPGALLENIVFNEGTNSVNFADGSITENTRVAYPIDHIDNAKTPSYGGNPKNIFFLTCDAFGILPPISKLTTEQAMYHFISGYTAKVAGTEVGVTEPQTTFSACFGRVFLPLHPTKYADLLGKKLAEHPEVNVWLINTGWSGGAYGTGHRMSLKHTRSMITAALNGELNNVAYTAHDTFGVLIPQSCPNVPSELLNPRDTWADKAAYDEKAKHLAELFVKNFEKYAAQASPAILSAAPKI